MAQAWVPQDPTPPETIRVKPIESGSGPQSAPVTTQTQDPGAANPQNPQQPQQPSEQVPSPSSQLPEPPVKDPQVQPSRTPDITPPVLTIPRLPRAPSLDDFLTMRPQGDVALQMAKVTGFTQRNPHDGQAVTEPTEAYLGYDQKFLYVVFVCFDDPGKVRGRLSRREDVYDDDQVEIILDTFHDRRRAYAFQTTPLGVQWDAIWTEASREEVREGHFDTSFDTVWD